MAVIHHLTPTKFLQYQEAFYCECVASPLRATLKVQVVNNAGVTDDDNFAKFVGDSERTETLNDVPVLWERTLDPINRSKWGIEQSRDTTLYIPPKVLERKLGTYNLRTESIRVTFMEREWLVDKIQKLSPLYASCIALEFHLQSATKGGQ